MATETLRIDITVEQKRALADLKLMDDRLLILQKQLKKTTEVGGIIKLQDEIRGLKGEMDALSKTASNNVTKGSNQAANALTNLGRVAQDAPFGFIGIQNNLNPLLESFQRLKAESGSTGGALKTLAGSLIGPAGLGLALSVGSALLLAFGDRLFKTKKEISETAKAYQEFNDVQRSANKDAGKDIINAKILYEASQNVTLSMKDRLKAATELKDLYPQLLSKYSAEKIVLGEVKNLYTDLTAEIIKNARAKAFAAKISELEAKKLDAEVQINKIIAVQNRERSKTQNDAFNPQGIAAINKGTTAAQKNAAITARGTLKIKEQAAIINQATAEQKFYEAAIGKTNLQQQTVNDLTDAQVKKLTKAELKLAEYTKKIEAARAAFQKLSMGEPVTGNTSADTSFQTAAPNQGMVDRTMAVQEATKRQLDYANALRLTTQNEEIAAAGASMATSAFTSLGQALLMGQDFGEALSNTFKRIIIDLTQMVVKALLFKAIMASLTGGTSEVAGAAAGGGGFLGKLFKGLLGFADGGVVSGPKSGYPVMLHGTEAVLNPKQFKNLTSNMMNMGALQSQGSSQAANGEFVLRGNDLVLAMQRANNSLTIRR